MYDGMKALCEVWPRGAVDSDFHEPLKTAVPALLLSGEFDPATPPDYGATAAAGFEQHLHLVITGQGHGQTDLACVQRLLRDFVERGTVAGLDASCIGDIKPAPFFLSFSGSAP
jgi:pimeloyl-ACP methyl ester carboxylesterase